MTQISPGNGTETSESQTHSAGDSPALLLRNEDDAEHALDVRITDDDTVLIEGCHTVAGESQRAVGGTEIDGETVRIDLRADHGGAASLTLDRSERVPEFVVRRETIVVAGLN